MKKGLSRSICVENVSLLLLFIILLVLVTFIYSNSNSNSNSNKSVTINNWLNNLLPRDVLLDPYAAPYKDERYMVPNPIRNMIPINVSTNIGSVDTSYRQMGIITPLNGASKDNILSLMGRPLFTNRDKWQYYTISNQHNNVKLPITFKGKSALNDYGVDKIFDGDTIYVEGYNEAFRVTVYENDTIKYLPFV